MKIRIGKTMNTHKYKIGDLVKIKDDTFGWLDPSDGGVVKINYIWKGIHECCYKGDYFSFSYDDIDHEATEKLGNPKETGEFHEKIVSDGGPSSYYDFDNTWATWNDLADYKSKRQWKEHSFHLGNIGKAIMRWGDKSGASLEYDAKKIIYSGLRVLMMLSGKESVREYLEKLLDDKQFKE